GLLRLAQGRPLAEFAELQRALADHPADRVDRARLLPAFVELASAAGQLEAAQEATDELAALATLFGSDAPAATACWARGLVLRATGDPGAAVSPLREAVRRWYELDAPYEAARARTLLAEVYQSIADDDAAALELGAARATFERLGAEAAARHATELLRGHADTTTATFLFTDVCGSTSLIEKIGNGAGVRPIQWHDRTLRSLFEEHRGEEIDHAGDGFFVAFREPA